MTPARDCAPADAVVEAVRAGGLLEPGRPVMVMLSGGRDSVCLLDVAVAIAGPGAVRALHVNYGLRPEADDDQRHCRRLCRRLGVPLAVERAGRSARPAQGNLQAWARELRYEAARRLAAGGDGAAGHTASDQAETVLYRLAASPGRRALLGMAPREGVLVRPLLGVTREQTAAHCRLRGLEWRDDPSNAWPVFARTRVRDDLLAALRSLHPSAQANVVRTAQLLREEAEVLDAAVDAVLGGARSIDVGALGALPAALRRLVLRRLAEDSAGRPAPQAAARMEEIVALAGHSGTASLDVGAGLRAVVEYGRLRFATGQASSEVAEPAALGVPGSVRFGAYLVTCGWAPPERRDGMLDARTLSPPLTVRPWRPGDRMAPVGLGGTRSLQDLFTDRRIPRERRHELPVVASRGRIAWVPQVATAEPFRVTEATREAVCLAARVVA